MAVAVLISGFVVIDGRQCDRDREHQRIGAPALMRAPVVPKLVWPVVPVTVPQLDVPFATQVALADSVMPAGQRIGDRHIERVGKTRVRDRDRVGRVPPGV